MAFSKFSYISAKMPEVLLSLQEVHGIGSSTSRVLVENASTMEELIESGPGHIKLSDRGKSQWNNEEFWDKAFDNARMTIFNSRKLGIESYSFWDNRYPALLHAIPDPPLIIYVKGSIGETHKKIACVGTREPTIFGKTVTEKVTSHFAGRGWSIVSGLAFGVDSIAHEAALNSGGHTIAVLAGPLDSIYPKKNTTLADKILESGGALISEQPLNSVVGKGNFVRRDRIQSGLSLATIIFQTGIVGGAMHTAKFTLLQERLLVVPVPTGIHANEEKSQGILLLSKCIGTELFSKIGTTDDKNFMKLISSKFKSQPAAYSIHSSSDYYSLEKHLENLLYRWDPSIRAIGQSGLFD